MAGEAHRGSVLYYSVPDEAEPQDPSIWAETLPGDEHNSMVSQKVEKGLVRLAFGTTEERAAGVRLPFRPLSGMAEAVLSPGLKEQYLLELCVACDAKSGSWVVARSDVEYGPATQAILDEYGIDESVELEGI